MAINTTLEINQFLRSGDAKDVSLGGGLYLRKSSRCFFVRYRVNLNYKAEGTKHDSNKQPLPLKLSEYTIPEPYGSGENETTLAAARIRSEEIRLAAKKGIDLIGQEKFSRTAAEFKVRAELDDAIAARTKAAEDARNAHKAKRDAEALERALNRTVADLFDAWVNGEDGVRRADGNTVIKQYFEKDVLPVIGAIPLRSLEAKDIYRVLRLIDARGAKRVAVMVYQMIVQMLRWAEQGQPWRALLTTSNPIARVKILNVVGNDYDLDNKRDRCLSASEIRELHSKIRSLDDERNSALDKRSSIHPLKTTTECAIWIMLGTLCRVGETLMARWEHISFDTGEWFIPKRNTKGRENDLIVYMSPFVLGYFQKLFSVTGESEWCFPATNTNEHVCLKSVSKQIGDRQTQLKKNREGNQRGQLSNRTKGGDSLMLSSGRGEAWTAHDLRRTGATMMQELGVSLDIIDRCQNHVLGGSKVRRHYLHHTYEREMRAAWQALGERLSIIVSDDDNVIPADFGRVA